MLEPMRRIAAGFLLLLAFAAVAAAQEHRVEVYKVQHRLAEELAPAIRDIIKDTGTVTVDPRTNSLILSAPGGRMDLALQVLALQDAPPRTVVVEYRNVGTLEMERAGVAIRWSVKSGDVRVGNVAPPRGGDEAALALYAEWVEEHREFTGMLRVLEGVTGRIDAGRSQPIRSGQFSGLTGYMTVSSGFQVTPRILGNGQVRLRLTPRNAAVLPNGSVGFSGALTTVDVTPGETLALGSVQRKVSGTQHGTSGVQRTEGTDEEVLLVRVRVE